MFKPIVITEHGEKIRPLLDDRHKLWAHVGEHWYCSGEIWVDQITLNHRVMFCKVCNLRIVIPDSVSTYGKLRKYLAQFQQIA